jgi:hypothetical protein
MSERGTKGHGTGRDGGTPDRRQARSRRPNESASPPEAPPTQGEPKTHPTTGEPETSTHQPKLTVEVVWADITRAKGEAYLVGHYMGVRPQKAELALDRAVSGYVEGRREKLLITEWTSRGALRGALGEVAFFPWDSNRIVGVAGMGGLGTFHKPQLKILARNVARSVGLLPHHMTIATVLIGSGPGNLAVRDAVQGLVEGVAQALSEDSSLKIEKLRIVEQYLDRAIEILDVLKDLSRKPGLDLDITSELADEGGGEISPEFGCSLLLASLADFGDGLGDSRGTSMLDDLLTKLPYEGLPNRVRARLGELKEKCKDWEGPERLRRLAMCFRLREEEEDPVQPGIASRVRFGADGQNVSVAAITNKVTVTERQVAVNLSLLETAVERLMDPPVNQLKEVAEMLYHLLVHSDVKSILKSSDPLVVEVDWSLSRVQWEMLPSTDSDYDYRPLGVTRPVARQLRTPYSPRADETPLRQQLRALVIGDPGDPALHHSLEDARDEARAVFALLKERDVDAVLLIGAPEDGTKAGPFYNEGFAPADYFEVVRLLLSGKFDIVHYCGHAQFDPSAPERAGWVFKGGVLTARELEGMERPPSLVVANACLTAQFSPVLSPASAPTQLIAPSPQRGTGLVASLADEFFRRGVSNYIGTAWEVPSIPAKVFAMSFYGRLLDGLPLGETVRQAREELYARQNDFGTVWAAYQHYGDPTRVLKLEAAENGPPGR